ncbi:hypothetical protein [Rhodococcoides fascians]|uniref:hypothetical protein n=1 Tax=Rhodococcoides fascians TaxID=1828 RepID=UPI0037A00E96
MERPTALVHRTIDGIHGALSSGGCARAPVRSGLPFTTGVVLAHSKQPASAMVISDFPCDLQLDGKGRWAASFPQNFWLQALATVALYGYAVAGLAVSLGYS